MELTTNDFAVRHPLEECVLGLLWLDFPNDSAMQAINPHWFDDATNRRLFGFICDLRKNGKQADMVLEWDHLTAFEKLRLFSEAINRATSSALMPTYIRDLRQRYTEKQTNRLLAESGGQFPPDARRMMRTLLDDLDGSATATWSTPRDILPGVFNLIEKRRLGGMEMPTGFRLLDDATDGLHPGELWVLGAYTNVGKTVCMTSIAHLLFRRGKRVMYFTTEMAREEFVLTRLMPAFSGVHALKIRHGELDDAALLDIKRGADRLTDMPLWVVDASFPSLEDIRATIRQVKPEAVFLDHIHRCALPRAENRNLALTEFVSGLKTLARDEGIPIVAAAQLNRTSQGQGDKAAPSLEHLRDSGSLEMESDVVILLSRKMEKDYAGKARPGKTIRMSIAKNRHGDTATFEMELDPASLLIGEKDLMSGH